MNQTSTATKAAAWVGCIIALLVGAVMLFGSLSTSSYQAPAAGTVVLNPPHEEVYAWGFGSGIQVGPPSQAGDVLKLLAAGTCNLSTTNSTLAASSTGQFTCQAGSQYSFQSTDMVIMDLGGAAHGAGGFGTISPVGPSYISTAGQNPTITTYLQNNSGAATSSYSTATTSAEFFVFRVL